MRITLKIGELREKIASELMNVLTKESFLYKKTNSWFIHSDGNVDNIVYILLHSRTDHYAIEIFLFIRHKQVEKILKKIVGNSTGITVGNTIGDIYNSPDGRKVVHNLMEIIILENADIYAAVETITQYYSDIIKPYFEKYNNLDAVNDIINNPPFEYTPAHIGGMFDDRCMRGLIIARLTNNPNYQELLVIYDEAIKRTMNPRAIEDYNKVKEYLNYNSL